MNINVNNSIAFIFCVGESKKIAKRMVMQTLMPRNQGNCGQYTREKHDIIVSYVRRNVPYELAAGGARIAEHTFYNWMNQGKEDIKNGVSSEYAQLLQDIILAETEKVAEHLDHIEAGKEAWQARFKILERRWRKYFGQDSAFYQELLERATKIEEAFKRITETNLQGRQISHGTEIHSKSD